jgi:hypothetical protein
VLVLRPAIVTREVVLDRIALTPQLERLRVIELDEVDFAKVVLFAGASGRLFDNQPRVIGVSRDDGVSGIVVELKDVELVHVELVHVPST